MRILFLLIAGVTVASAQAQQGTGAPRREAKPEASVPFKVVGDRIFVPVTLNDEQKCEALLDTGSEVTLLNRARLKVKGLRLELGADLHGDFVGALAVDNATLDSLAIGASARKRLRIGVLNHGPGQKLEKIDFLLGTDVLGDCRFTLDFTGSQLLVWGSGRGDLPKAGAGTERFRLALQPGRLTDDRRPRVLGTVNQKGKAAFLVDTGADSVMFVATSKLEELGLKSEALSGLMTVRNGALRQQLRLHLATFERLTLDKLVLENVAGRVVDASELPGGTARSDIVDSYNVIGMALLQKFAAVHFVPRDGVYFDRPAVHRRDAETPRKEGDRLDR